MAFSFVAIAEPNFEAKFDTPSHAIRSSYEILQAYIPGRGDPILAQDPERHGLSSLAGFAGPSRTGSLVNSIAVPMAPSTPDTAEPGAYYSFPTDSIRDVVGLTISSSMPDENSF